MTLQKRGKSRLSSAGVGLFGSVALLAGCDSAPTEPQPVFPEMPAPDTFTRAYKLVESPDGKIRVFAKENGDETMLYESLKQSDGTWSKAAPIDLPHVLTLSGPAFSPVDGSLFYVSDEPLEAHKGRRENNIWRARRKGDAWIDPQPLPLSINTGAVETSPTIDGEGRLYFATNHSRAGGGGLDIMEAAQDPETGEWLVQAMPEGINSSRADDHLAVTRDGSKLFFYSHRSPKLGIVDIWMTERGDDGVWQLPKRLAEPVNSETIDFGAGISGDGETFFFSRDGVLMQFPMSDIQVVEE